MEKEKTNYDHLQFLIDDLRKKTPKQEEAEKKIIESHKKMTEGLLKVPREVLNKKRKEYLDSKTPKPSKKISWFKMQWNNITSKFLNLIFDIKMYIEKKRKKKEPTILDKYYKNIATSMERMNAYDEKQKQVSKQNLASRLSIKDDNLLINKSDTFKQGLMELAHLTPEERDKNE